jgi:predicted kinase
MGRGASTRSAAVRTVKIGAEERSGYSSDAPRRRPGHNKPSKAQVDKPQLQQIRKAKGRRLAPSHRLSYSPKSLIIVAGPDGSGKDDWTQRLFPAATVISAAQMTELASRNGTAPDEVSDKRASLLRALTYKRLRAGQTVIVDTAGLDERERNDLVAIANLTKRPAHLIVFEAGLKQCLEAGDGAADESHLREQIGALAELRQKINRNQLGEEGFATVITLSRAAARDVRRVAFEVRLPSSHL